MSARKLRHHPILALLVGVSAWLLPGSGHILLRQWTRGLGVFLTVGALAAIGVGTRGHLFTLAYEDFFDLLGYLADCGAGVFFYLAQRWNNGGPDVAHAAGDYGTRFFAAAGVLNVLAAVDAYRIARGAEGVEGTAEDDAGEGQDPSEGNSRHREPDEASQLRLGEDVASAAGATGDDQVSEPSSEPASGQAQEHEGDPQ